MDYADKIAAEIYGDWMEDLSDARTVQDMIADGVRRGYNLAYGAAE